MANPNPKSLVIPDTLMKPVTTTEEAVTRLTALGKHFGLELENTIGFSVSRTLIMTPINGNLMGYCASLWDENTHTPLAYQTGPTEEQAITRAFSDLNGVLPQWIGTGKRAAA